ncbi:hypothetical protein [Lysinibacillus sp.]|uniref:hypothetical protein n=1 Tax=Lysinibacillus sp. TaxID=1869345 RepID=UPI0028B179B5|nr:hypothetical protein [Lysinibacillus sp.]
MNFIRLKTLVSSHLHTILLLLGMMFIVAAVQILTNIGYTLLTSGIFIIIIALLIERGVAK